MSTIGADKIREKVTQRLGNELLRELEGLETGALVKSSNYDFSWHAATTKENSAFESTPALLLPLDNFLEVICKKFEEFTEKYGSELLVQFEQPFILKIKIREPETFIRSLYQNQRTKDLTIFKVHPDAIFEAQELEYDIKLFVIARSI
ncbi:hypothetical protein [Variovorax paradoxus]|uniref:hypothetical protein n=1 Tax=Variovorax paradoxus TaxID=34073 RepID=UPI0012D42EE8|nr:hypothetical protein [Variovorax paradoxus]